MKKDTYHHEAIYNNWKDKVKTRNIKGISKANSDLIKAHIFDMEIGQNTAKGNKKGARSYGRLNVARTKLIQVIKWLEERGVKNIAEIKEKQLHVLVDDLYKGKIKKQNGEPFSYPQDYIKNFKSLWHWYMKVQRKLHSETEGKKGKILLDITEDISTSPNENSFVYLTKAQVDKMLPYFTEGEQVLVKFLFDSIIRFPTECLSLTAKDCYEKDGEVWINIPTEVSKKSGRHFNLLYCGDALLKFIKEKELEADDYIFNMDNNKVYQFNKKLKKVAVQLFGDRVSHPKAKKKYSQLSGYDFRHNGTIHLRILAQKNNSISLDAIRERGGWSDFKMLNFYTKFIGLSGEIKKEALLIEEDRTRLEKDVEALKEELKKAILNKEEALDEMHNEWTAIQQEYFDTSFKSWVKDNKVKLNKVKLK